MSRFKVNNPKIACKVFKTAAFVLLNAVIIRNTRDALHKGHFYNLYSVFTFRGYKSDFFDEQCDDFHATSLVCHEKVNKTSLLFLSCGILFAKVAKGRKTALFASTYSPVIIVAWSESCLTQMRHITAQDQSAMMWPVNGKSKFYSKN